jgi:hypothetical protein
MQFNPLDRDVRPTKYTWTFPVLMPVQQVLKSTHYSAFAKAGPCVAPTSSQLHLQRKPYRRSPMVQVADAAERPKTSSWRSQNVRKRQLGIELI